MNKNSFDKFLDKSIPTHISKIQSKKKKKNKKKNEFSNLKGKQLTKILLSKIEELKKIYPKNIVYENEYTDNNKNNLKYKKSDDLSEKEEQKIIEPEKPPNTIFEISSDSGNSSSNDEEEKATNAPSEPEKNIKPPKIKRSKEEKKMNLINYTMNLLLKIKIMILL